MSRFSQRGQSLIELLIGMSISVVMIGAASGSLFLILRSGQVNEQQQVAGSLANALLDNVTSFSEGRWQNVYDLPKGSGNLYYLATTTGQFVAIAGQQPTVIGGITYQRSFYMDNVSRNPATQDIEPVYNPADDDPSTQKVTVHVAWNQPGSVGSLDVTSYVVRWNLRIAQQTEWKGGPGMTGPVTEFGNRFDTSTGIDYTATGSIKIQGF